MVNNKIKVLIIDDNPDNILSLKAVIQTMLPETIIATALNGKTGIVLAKENDPDIILLDIVMPIMNGYQVCEIIKKDKDLMKIPVVFITALNANNEVRLKAIEVGAEGFLSKPIDELAMLTQIKSMAKIKKANTQQVLKRDELEKLVLVRTSKLDEELRQRIKAENLLKESEDKLRYNFDNSPIGISIVKMTGEIEVNNTLCKMLGYSKTKLEKVKWLDLTHPNDIETNQSIFNMVVNGKKDSMNYKKRLIKKDGTIVWADIHISLRKNSEGKPLYFITAIINITEQKKILEKLNQSEKRNREWLENSPVCTKILDQDFNLQYMSSIGVNGLGIKDITKYYNRPYPLDFFTESFSSVMRENLEHSKSTGKITTLEAPLYDLDQNEVWFHSTIVPIMDDVDELDYFIVVSLDVTQRKKAEYLMQKQKDDQRLLLEQLQTGILLISADKKILFANHFAAKTFNQTRNQMENMNVKDVPWSPISENGEELSLDKYPVSLIIKNKSSINNYIARLKTQNPTDVKWLNISGFPVYDSNNLMKNVVISFNDITESKKNADAIKLNQEKLKSLTSNISDVIGILDKNGIIKYKSDNIERIFGWRPDELIGKSALITVHHDDLELIKKTIRNLINNQELYIEIEFRYLCKDGTYKHVQLSAKNMINNMNINGILINYRDITDRKRAQESKTRLEGQLRNQQKLESISTLASGVAHEINNPINGIMNYGQIILDTNSSDSIISQSAYEIIHETKRVATIVNNLLDFSRQNSESHSKANIEDIIEQVLSLIRTIIKQDQIELEVVIEKNIPKTDCRSQQIQQVLMNLLTNARDALNDKYTSYNEDKKIIVLCEKIRKEEKDWVRITVEDHGNGIPEPIQDKIFDPFFTTKDRSTGTGLGLSISYGIIQEHNGEISFETIEGKSTKFMVDLPIL